MRGPVAAALAQADGGTLLSALLGLAGAAAAAAGSYLARRYRLRAEAARAGQRQLFAQYRRLVADLRQQVARLGAEVEEAQRHYLECRLENAALRARAVELEKEVLHLRGGMGDGAGGDAGAAGGAGPEGGPAA
jgi:hypothetical protein